MAVTAQQASVRPAAVAGAFYPASPQTLARDISEMLEAVDLLEPRLGVPKALIVPHAGYMYSGPMKARAYDALAPARGLVKRVVLLGPAHFVAGRGLALPGVGAFETPLGRVPLDAAAIEALGGLRQVVHSAPAHAQEHSLEVQLPFLQHVLGDFSLVPIALGAATTEEVAQVLERLWGGPETLIVISTDLSHYMDYDSARRVDGNTLEKIARFATDIDHVEACGATPLNGFLALAKKKGLSIRLLGACNSGDTAGGRERVVGYSAFALYEGGEVSLDKAGGTLLAIARVSIAHALGLGPKPRRAKTAWLNQLGASFVTLTIEGKLRGCIGSLSPSRPLGEDVAANALAAAFQDPRFAPLTREEWQRCEIEVSLLSPPRSLPFADEEELLSQLAPGEDGVILEHQGKRATFLPQVWQGLPDKRLFLGELVKKAGLPPDTRLARCRVWRYRVSKFHGRALVA